MRTNNREEVVSEFHEAMDLQPEVKWTKELLWFRRKLIREEYLELMDEFDDIELKLTKGLGKITKEDKSKLLKELADLQYVVSGAAVQLELPLQQAFVRVHNSNMSKLGDNGKPIKREDGKVLKGPNYTPPVLEDLFKQEE